MPYAYPFPNCDRCGYAIDAERDLDPVEQRKYELHMLAEQAMATARLADRMAEIYEQLANHTLMVSTP